MGKVTLTFYVQSKLATERSAHARNGGGGGREAVRATHRHPPTPPPSRWLVPAGLQRHVSQREGASVLSEPANSCPQTGTLPPPCHYSPTPLPSGNKKKQPLARPSLAADIESFGVEFCPSGRHDSAVGRVVVYRPKGRWAVRFTGHRDRVKVFD